LQKLPDIPNKRTRQNPNSKTSTNTSEALFDFLVKSEEVEEAKVKINTVTMIL